MSDLTRDRWRALPVERYVHFPVLPLEEDYEDRLAFPPGRHSVVLGLGGVPVEIRTGSDALLDYLNVVFGPFAEATDPICRLAIEVTEEPLPFRPQLGNLAMFERGDHVVAKFRDMVGYVDAKRGAGRALIHGLNFRQDLSNYLRFALDALLPLAGGVLFHTAAVARAGRAYLFYGVSGAGKSTLSALAARRHEIMTDDMLVLRLQGGELRAACCGFWGGETRCYPTKRIDLPVAGLYRLAKSATNRLVRIEPVQGVLDLICGVPNMTRPADHHRRILAFAGEAAARAAFWELHFHPNDDSFWSVIDGA